MNKLMILVLGVTFAAWVNAQAVLLTNPPRSYVCQFTHSPIVIDGRDTEEAWQAIPWSEEFLDIEGPAAPPPFLKTQVKMLWDKHYLYILARLEEPHLWATLTERESIIFQENDFEVFIDPDGDTRHYYELEINARGTTWDLMLTRPYSLMGKPISAWDIVGLQKGIHLAGTLNDPTDTDTAWMIELAFPFKILLENNPNRSTPLHGESWRINFSRVEWALDVLNNQYVKKNDLSTGKALLEYNWVWTPQYQINMHKPEYWGFVLFSENEAGTKEIFSPHCNNEIYFALRQLFQEQYSYYIQHRSFAKRLHSLSSGKLFAKKYHIKMLAMKTAFYLYAPSKCDDTWLIMREDGSIRKSKTPLAPVL